MNVFDLSFSSARPGQRAAIFAQGDQEIQQFACDRDAESAYEVLSNILCDHRVEYVNVVRLFQIRVDFQGNTLAYVNMSEQEQRTIMQRLCEMFPNHMDVDGLSYMQVDEFLEFMEPGGHRLGGISLRPQTWKTLDAHEQERALKQLREADLQAAWSAQ